jgi:hypothetical protein
MSCILAIMHFTLVIYNTTEQLLATLNLLKALPNAIPSSKAPGVRVFQHSTGGSNAASVFSRLMEDFGKAGTRSSTGVSELQNAALPSEAPPVDQLSGLGIASSGRRFSAGT